MRRLPRNLRTGLFTFSVFFLSVGCATVAKHDVMVVVKKNDTLRTIAYEYGSTWESIVELNETTLADGLREGQTLKVHPSRDPELLAAKANEADLSNSEENVDDEELDVLKRSSKGLIGPQSKEPISLIYPVESRISSHFGKRGRKNHKGIDIAANVGTPIVAAGDGEVIFSGRQRGYGLTVVVDHGQFMTLYAHASKLIARVGAKVRQSDFIAKVGRSGNARGAHLHFELRDFDNKPLDPELYLHHKTVAKIRDSRRVDGGAIARALPRQTKYSVKKPVVNSTASSTASSAVSSAVSSAAKPTARSAARRAANQSPRASRRGLLADQGDQAAALTQRRPDSNPLGRSKNYQ
jgi:lipoprotein NlpD